MIDSVGSGFTNDLLTNNFTRGMLPTDIPYYCCVADGILGAAATRVYLQLFPCHYRYRERYTLLQLLASFTAASQHQNRTFFILGVFDLHVSPLPTTAIFINIYQFQY
jgi:hypothetical protein